MATAPVDEMPLLCELGWHKADPLARWNAGYYFTTCARCGHDLVRTAYGGWRVPKGFKIVWQAKPPESAVAAELIPDPDAELGDADQMELPIQEVLRHMEAEEQAEDAFPEAADAAAEPLSNAAPADHEPLDVFAEDEPGTEAAAADEPRWEPELEPVFEPDPEPLPSAAKTPAVDDFMEDDWFMNDEPGYDSWDRAAEHDVDTLDRTIVDDDSEHVGNRSGKIRYGKEVDPVAPGAPASFLSMLRAHRDEAAEVEEEADPAPTATAAAGAPSARPGPHAGIVATLVGTFGVLLLLIAAVGGGWELRQTEAATTAPSGAQAAPAAAPAPGAAAASLARPEETGFVTASLLNCRTAPAEQAEPVRILPRGEPVRVLALEPAWASISHRGRQCWASTRYLSAQQPL
jgi:hypothetical protein